MVAAERQPEDLADAAAADRADDGRGAHVDLGAQQRVGDEVGHHLRHDGEAHALDPAGADRPQALVGPHVGVLDDLEEQLAQARRWCGSDTATIAAIGPIEKIATRRPAMHDLGEGAAAAR